MFPTPTTRPNVVSCRICNIAVSGSKVKTAGCACACPTLPCAPLTRLASTLCSPICVHAANCNLSTATVTELKANHHARQDQTGIDRRHRSLLHHHQEQADHAQQDGNQKVRPGCPQARDLQGNQAEVIQPRLPVLLTSP